MKNKGITLVALIITIIILLILAGITIGQLTGNGLFNKATGATQKYGEAKAQETLELALAEATTIKVTDGLTDEQFVALMESKGFIVDDNQITVEGYIFEVSKDNFKITSNEGKAQGVLIRAKSTSEWALPANAKATVSGSITSTEGNIETATLTKTGIEAIDIKALMDAEGNYTTDLTDEGEYTLTATDDKGNTKTKTVNVVVKSDNTAPTIEAVTVTPTGLKFKFTATGNDKMDGVEQSGISKFKYTISPTTELDKASGEFNPGETVEITSTQEATYTISVTAVDKVGNEIQSTNATTATVNTIDGLTIAQAKATINASNIKDYIGIKITDYNPSTDTTGIYRIFFLDTGNKYGDGTNTLFIKRDRYYSSMSFSRSNFSNYEFTEAEEAMMEKFNPLWKAMNGTIDTWCEKGAAYICGSENFSNYYNASKANYVIGSPSVELFIDAYNQWCGTVSDETSSLLNYKFIKDDYGYSVGSNGSFTNNGDHSGAWSVSAYTGCSDFWIGYELASTSRESGGRVATTGGYNEVGSGAAGYFSPIVSLK